MPTLLLLAEENTILGLERGLYVFLFLCLHPLGSGGVVEHFSSHTSRFFSCARVFCLLASKRGGTLFPLPSDRTTLLRPLNLLSLIISNTLSWCYGSERRTILVICSLFLVSFVSHLRSRTILILEFRLVLYQSTRSHCCLPLGSPFARPHAHTLSLLSITTRLPTPASSPQWGATK
ncbi:uncharacterized protein BO66DRAFT_87621 [Aspergillus aculeatinus CBS 121060]|uniref:Uncharacterized protein n=1 Tax=Aspergillus aculeatinus CBS 121060 TaxID=1448322 RepID=A0ACD1H9J6_9EURO|nr:hypothetical protein BO66DRAFT_87621 [Aspergillus aculeatinus CBS 121060]RAH70087.1 hypothetical protein BO66DRAFT_87621 [Aspergillus aculeatinus CBS 121060]